MNYAILLAGGVGARMENPEGIPKQFLTINEKPIIIYALENILECKKVDKIIVVCHKDYLGHLQGLLAKYNLEGAVEIVEGGTNRLKSAVNGVRYIERRFSVSEEDIFMAHDAARIFTSQRIFEENLEKAKEFGAATTVYALEETILEAGEDGLLFKAEPREGHFTGQSPQTFNVKKFLDLLPELSDEAMERTTDIAEVFYLNGEKVFPVMGEKNNIKITTPLDLMIAKLRITN